MLSQRVHVFISLDLTDILLHAGPETGEPDTMIVQQRENHCGAEPDMVVWATGFVGWSGVQLTVWSTCYWHHLIIWHWPLRGCFAWFAFGNVLPLLDLLTPQDFLIVVCEAMKTKDQINPLPFFGWWSIASGCELNHRWFRINDAKGPENICFICVWIDAMESLNSYHIYSLDTFPTSFWISGAPSITCSYDKSSVYPIQSLKPRSSGHPTPVENGQEDHFGEI